MSDLQCAATLLLAAHGDATYDGGLLTPLGSDQAHALGRGLRGARLAGIYASDLAQAVQTAEIVAAETGVPVTVLPGTGWPAELEGIADLHRGETVLVVAHPASIQAVTSLSVVGCGVVEVAVDADGWVLRSRAGAPDARHWS